MDVRPAREADLGGLIDISNHYVVHSHATFDLEPFTVEQRRGWFGQYAPTGPHRLLVGEVDGAVHVAVAGVAMPGPESIALQLRHGFQPVGTFSELGYKFGRYIDVQWFQLRVGPPTRSSGARRSCGGGPGGGS